MFLRIFIPGGVGFAGCFFSIYWFPFATIPFTLDALLQSILYPTDFFFGGISFLMGMWGHSMLLRNWIITPNKRGLDSIIFVLLFLSPFPLVILSLKVVIAFFLFVLIYGMINSTSQSKKSQVWQNDYKTENKM
ncbi:hypothetical protein GLW05_03800 [Pontibacillus yanchengensis]|uniref:Uncharacterized protein n=1 Tax=Pontibacillus yanchengensis TaxID=462910 RepID=A0A6I4ZR69_9BACI|nr:hypothetical protein [Pontibacillus yanchengensis]MYL32715.1 hypothetical protein [Pontibacillus yanchengensis]